MRQAVQVEEEEPLSLGLQVGEAEQPEPCHFAKEQKEQPVKENGSMANWIEGSAAVVSRFWEAG